jgi:hypothetical protein
MTENIKKRTRLALNTPEQVRLYIQKLMIRVEKDEIGINKARLLTQQAETILKAILQKESDDRLAMLEEELESLIEEDSL